MNKKIKPTLCALTMAGMTFASLSASGQDIEPIATGNETSDAQAQGQRLPVTFRGGVSYQSEADIDSGGKFSVTRLTAGAGLPLQLQNDLTLTALLRYEAAIFDFKDISDPWKDIHTISAVPLVEWKMDQNWSFYGGAILRMSAESGADFRSSFSGGGMGGCNYTFNDRLTLGGGLAVVSRIEDDAMVLPLFTLNWRFADAWKLKAGFLDVTTIGYGGELAWEFHPRWAVAFGAQFHQSRFRVDTADEVGQERALIVYGGVTWHATETVDLNGFVGTAAGGNLRIEDGSGKKIGDSDYDPAPIFGVRANIRL